VIGFLGDVHGKYDAIGRAMSMPGIDAWLQVGDLGGEDLPYPPLPSGFWFVKGNHENWKALEVTPTAPVGPYLRNGAVYEIPLSYTKCTVRVATFGGNFSPRYSSLERRHVPPGRERHFLLEEKNALLSHQGDVDILLTHEAPAPYVIGPRDCGQTWITELSAYLKPKVHVFGHHHRYGIYNYGGVKTVGLEYGWSHCVLWDEVTGDMRWEALPA
jgi:hypothetical protein